MTSTAHALSLDWQRDRFGGRGHALLMRTNRLSAGGLLALAALLSFAPLLALAGLSIKTGDDSIRRQVDNRLASSAALSARFVGATPGLGRQVRASGITTLVSSSLPMSAGIKESTADGRRLLSASAAIPALGWYLLAQADRAVALAGAADLQRNLLLTTAALALVMVVGLWVTGVSMRQRRRADMMVSDATQQRQQLLDALPVGVFVVGRDGRPQYANQMSTALLGRAASPDIAPGEIAEAYRVFVAGTDQLYPADRIPVTRALAGESLRVDDLEVERDGGRVALECWANPIYDRAGHAVGAVATFLDVSARKQAQHDILDLNTALDGRVTARTAELAASNEELEAFTYSVSHDLRAPLRAMSGFASKLQQKIATRDEPELARYAERIAVNATRMGELIDQLLTFSRLNRQDPNKSSFSPTQAVQRALEDLGEEVDRTHAQVTVADMPMAVGDPGLVQEVFANLLSNALKYSGKRAQPTIDVGTITTAGAATTYFVRDNGAGFDMRFKDKLFGVFQRLHGADEYEGIGVGLAIVKRIVTRHGGEVFAEGAVDGGATFSFTLGGP